MEYLLEVFLLILTLIIAGSYVYEKKIVKRRSHGKVSIPGLEKTHPRLGNIGELSKHGSLHKFLEHLHGEFGNVASFYWNDTLVVSICDHASFKYVKHLFNRPHILFDNFKPFIGEECIQFANGVEGKDRRKCYDHSFSAEAVVRYIETMERVGVQELERVASSDTRTIDSIQLVGLTMAIKSVMRTCIVPDQKENSFYIRMIYLYKIVFDGLTARLVDKKTFKKTDLEEIKFREAQNEFDSIIRGIVMSRIKVLEEEKFDKKTEKILIDNIIRFHGDINSEVIVKDVLVYLIGGFHTSGNLFGWCLYYLAKNPEWQEKIFEEIIQNKVNLSNNKENLNALNNLSFLRACINETLRLSEVAPFAGRLSNDDISLGPYFIPANTPVILSLAVAHHDPHIFKDPHLFNPLRFINQNLPSLSFVPFGFAGKRKCPAERFAYLEVSIWLLQFIKGYKFTLKNAHEDVQKVYGIVTHMDRDVSVVFEDR